ncbi:polyhydroxyalkanoic acid system family protein [Peredibacter sp. HCB2-198]|uniref:polyhydroxyalkanoic acid system family protein n=1 Tax=Peredibacter sp. HCB2-198 TaxID=3383025 RepID=UPI0038B5339D
MELKVPYAQITDKKQGYEEAKKLIPEVIAKFGVAADVQNDDATSTLKAKGSGFEAKIEFKDAEAVVNVDLGFLLKPFKGKILETIEKQIKKVV